MASSSSSSKCAMAPSNPSSATKFGRWLTSSWCTGLPSFSAEPATSRRSSATWKASPMAKPSFCQAMRLIARGGGTRHGAGGEEGARLGALVAHDIDCFLAFPRLAGADAGGPAHAGGDDAGQGRQPVRRSASRPPATRRPARSAHRRSAPRSARQRPHGPRACRACSAELSKQGRSSWTSEAQCRSSIADAEAMAAARFLLPQALATASVSRGLIRAPPGNTA